MKMKHILLAILAISLTACDERIYPNGTDACIRTKIFQECVASVNKAVTSIELHENGDGIGDAVRACDNAAYYQAYRAKADIPAGCFGGDRL